MECGVDCLQVTLARRIREPGQALTGAALSGVPLCGILFPAVVLRPTSPSPERDLGTLHFSGRIQSAFLPLERLRIMTILLKASYSRSSTCNKLHTSKDRINRMSIVLNGRGKTLNRLLLYPTSLSQPLVEERSIACG